MKIAIFINYVYPEKEGGTSSYVRDISHEFNKNHEVEIFACTKNKELEGVTIENGIKIHRTFLKKGDLGLLRFSNKRMYVSYCLPYLPTFDIINLQGIDFLPLKIIKLYRDKILLTVHASSRVEIWYDIRKTIRMQKISPLTLIRESMKYVYARVLEKKIVTIAPHIIVMSHYVKGYLLELYPHLNKKKIYPISIGIHFDKYTSLTDKVSIRKNYEYPENAIIFLTIRRLVPRMGILNLLEAIKMVIETAQRNDDYLFLIGGKGPLYNEADKKIYSLQLQTRVQLLGYVPNEDLINYYQLADCFILPTEELEGFGIVALEALASNCPVIGTNVGAIPEILSHFQKDLITKSSRPKDIAEKILLYLDKYRGATVGNRQKAMGIYSWPKIMGHYELVFSNYTRSA